MTHGGGNFNGTLDIFLACDLTKISLHYSGNIFR
jgi:hypothetical protein